MSGAKGADTGVDNNDDVPFLYTGQPRVEIPRDVTRVDVDQTVSAIGHRVFLDCRQLEEVELFEGLDQIGSCAFSGCVSLKQLRIPSTVKRIGRMAFHRCKKLVHVELCQGLELERIQGKAFFNCYSLKRIEIPSSVVLIGKEAFFNCRQLEEVELCEGLEQIGGDAFRNCKSLTRITIPSTVQVIGNGAFHGCKSLMTVELSEEIQKIFIGKFAFQHCDLLRNIVIPPTARASQCVEVEGCHDLLKLFTSQQEIDEAVKRRFDALPVHKLCYYHSQHPTQVALEREWLQCTITSVKHPNEASPLSTFNLMGNAQDCLGMTPLHVLACSTKHNLDLYQSIIHNHPNSMITEDKWGCLPILYAIWGGAPNEIIQFLIDSLKCTFPKTNIDWDKMIGILCRAGASLNIIQRLLQIQHRSFLGSGIIWERVARELTICCLVRCESFKDFWLIWGATIEASSTFPIHEELVRSLLEIRQCFFPDRNEANLQVVCEEFVQPVRGWWRPASQRESLETFQFLAKCSISERLDTIGIRKWRTDVRKMVERIPFVNSRELASHFDAIQSKLVSRERQCHQLKVATFLLELALWRSKRNHAVSNLGQSEHNIEDHSAATKSLHRINCGAAVIIPNVLTFLICS